MNKTANTVKNIAVTLLLLGASFGVCLLLQGVFHTQAYIPMVFVFGVFLIALLTDGYLYGTVGAFAAVIAVNYAFTFPYFTLNFTIPENLFSAVVMICIALLTGGLTTQIKHQELLKAQAEKERMRANLLRAISHDLRTPLTTIYGSSSAMLENEAGFTVEQRRQMLTGIREDAQWLTSMVENLLSVTRIDSGKVKIIKTPTVLEELVDSVLVKFKKRYPDQSVELDIPEELVVIPMDAILIQQVLINLLENAVQHAKNMTRLSLKVFTLGDKAVFEIQDDGCGIQRERLPILFTGCSGEQPPVADGGRRNAGIGLSVCDTIIRAHGGQIRAENVRTGGAVLRFWLDMEEQYEQ